MGEYSLSDSDKTLDSLLSPPVYAAYFGLHQIALLLIRNGVYDYEISPDIYCPNALIVAILRGDKDFVTLLLDNHVDMKQPKAYINTGLDFQGSALQIATMNCDQPMVQLLLEHGANVNAQGVLYGSPLQAAAAARMRGNKEIMQLLLDRGANINAQGVLWCNALQAAIGEDNLEVAELLLAHGAKADLPGPEWENLLLRIEKDPFHGLLPIAELRRF